MKNKKLIYFLLPAAALVWGLIIYKVSAGLAGEEETIGRRLIKPKSSNSDQVLEDTITLIANYKDPFLVKGRSKNTYIHGGSRLHAVPVRPARQPDRPTQPVKEPIQWPAIEYMGLIENKHAATKIVILHIAGKQYLLKEKESAEGVQLAKVEKDSLKVVFSKEVKFIKKAGS
jgi:type II secretory pathway component PulC